MQVSRRSVMKSIADTTSLDLATNSRRYRKVLNDLPHALPIRNTGKDYGIDWFTISFPILPPDYKSSDGWCVTSKIWPGGIVTESGSLNIKLNQMLVYVTVYERPQPQHCSRQYYCSVSFNPARLVDPKGILLCRVRALPMIVETVLQIVQRYVPMFPDMSMEDIRIKRLDVSCNFYGITLPSRLLTGLQAVPRRGKRSPQMHSGPSGAQTLTYTFKAGSVSLYDKSEQSPFRAPPGTMRFEIRARGDWLKRHELDRLHLVTVETVRNLFWDRARWFGLEAKVMTSTTACERIAFAKDIGPTVKVNLQKFIFRSLHGEDVGGSKSTANKYRRMLREMGFAPYMEDLADRSITRLDVKSKSEIQIA
jgi:hypothetical protein